MHRKAGSSQVIISSSKRWAKITEINNKKEKKLKELLNELDNTDIVIIEGFKNENHPKIEIISDSHKEHLFSSLKNVIALISEKKLQSTLPQFKIKDIDLITDFILKYNYEQKTTN